MARYGYVRLVIGDDKAGSRFQSLPKFVYITWAGASLPVMKRAKVSVDKVTLKAFMKDFSFEVHAVDKKELREEEIVQKLKKTIFID